ncbi:MAG: hypothetical protein O3B74_01260 [Proteobacteria bacterium]|nr:hypothetical protein [Pseudomonadota bacterium]MDA1308746.1 hypothetical protein [Pseudomonadota bacterium]
MEQPVLYTVVALALYFVAAKVLDGLERRAGHRFKHRSLIFFALLLGLAITSFALIRYAAVP